MSHPVEDLWREVGLPEYFLGNGGTNLKLYELYERIQASARRPDREELRNALHEIVTNGEHTPDGGWKVSAEVYDLAYNADVFGAVEQG